MRPCPNERNALNDALCAALVQACEQAAHDPGARVVVLCAAGPAFCAGGDVKSMAAPAAAVQNKGAQRFREMKHFMTAAKLLNEMPKPTVALVHGAAAGAGLSLALACDFRIGTPNAKLTTAFAKVGLSGDYGGTYFLQRIVGPAKARELYLLSPVLSGREALELGLVTRVYPEAEFEAEAAAFVRALASGPTTTYGFIKDNLNENLTCSFDDALDGEIHRHLRCKDTADYREAICAFAEKRAPVFRGH
ncbi:enoyl-CoA hydratase [Bordetella bronchiseptica]|nr:enoyl-CoA hydratase [Bordetella bronchiseptica]AUL16841.1 enoyl-CoA hydratase [Bordetella bronchiseptica]